MWELGTERMGLEAVIRLNEKSIRVSLRMEGSSQALVASALQTYTLRPVQSIDGVVPEDMDIYFSLAFEIIYFRCVILRLDTILGHLRYFHQSCAGVS